MSFEIGLIIGVIVIGFVVLYVLLSRLVKAQSSTDTMDAIVNQAFGLSAAKIAEQSQQLLRSERETIQVDLENKRRAIEDMVREVRTDLKSRQDELRLLEQDRTKKFSELTTQLENHRRLTDELRISTEQLGKVLSNNQQRGEWGERIIEDLLTSNGLIEGVHYLKQAKLAATTLRPDISLLLPNERTVPVDVKFPYAEIQKMSLAETKAARDLHLKQFSVDLKNKITKVAEYISPEYQTLDYAILFVPNEMVFSFINQKFPHLVDEAIAKRVLIVSPFTFLIVARTVLESYRNFMIGDKLKEVVRAIDEFVKEWGVFKDKFSKYGKSLQTLQNDYDELTGTRVRQMERKITRIEKYRQGTVLTEMAASVREEAEES